MQIERLRNGLELFNKINGQRYKVTEVSGGIGKAVKMLDDGTLTDESVLVVTADNCLAFRILADPEPYPIPEGYAVESGVLLKADGTPACEQAHIFIDSILAEQPGRFILTVAPKDKKEGYVDLFSYEPARDRFMKITPLPIPMPTLVGYVGNKAIVAYSKITEEKDEENGEMVRWFDGAAVLEIADGYIRTSCFPRCPITVEDIVIAKYGETEEYELYIPSDENGDEGGQTIPKDKRVWMKAVEGDVEKHFQMEGKIQAEYSPMYRNFVLHNADCVYVSEKDIWLQSKAAAAVVKDYPILVDVTKDGYSYRLTFGNDNYEMKTIVSTLTRDRGCIVTVE